MSDALPVVDDCWNRIGVRGDHSCPELKTAIHCQNCGVFAAATQLFFDRAQGSDYQREVTSLVAEADVAARDQSESVVAFVLGAEAFALSTRSFVEVTEQRPVHRVAHRTNRVFSGIVNVHGQLELCVSLAGLLEVEPDANAAGGERYLRMVVAEDDERRRWVFRADRVLGVHLVPKHEFQAPPSTLVRKTQSYVARVFRLGEQQVGYLDGAALFAAFERSVR